MVTSIASLAGLTLALSLLSELLFGYLWPGYILASMLFFFVTKLLLSRLQKLKYGKPHAYYQHLIIKKIASLGLIQSSYLMRTGKWSVRRIHP